MPTPPRPSRRSPNRSGFTLVELMMVVLLMGIVAASVIPAMGNVATMRQGAARDDLVRMIELTRARAAAAGEPCGLRIDLADSTISIVELDDAGDIQILPDPLTNALRTISIPQLYSGVTLTGMVNGDGASGSGVIWFDFASSPHTRTSSGAFAALNTASASITLSSGERVIVHPHSGTLEVQ